MLYHGIRANKKKVLRCHFRSIKLRWPVLRRCAAAKSARRKSFCRSHSYPEKARGRCHVGLYEIAEQNCHSRYPAKYAAGILFHNRSNHDRAVGRGQYCGCGIVRKFFVDFFRGDWLCRHRCRDSDRPVHRRRQRAGGMVQPECQPALRGLAVSSVFAGCRGLSGTDFAALHRRWAYSASRCRVF